LHRRPLTDKLAQACSLRLTATAGIGVVDEFLVNRGAFADLIEGVYVRNNGLLTQRGARRRRRSHRRRRVARLVALVDRRWATSLTA
jgi:hypothetical protein